METADVVPKISRERELDWMNCHRKEIESNYKGQWIVIDGDRLVAASADIKELKSKIKASGVVIPFVVYVPETIDGPTFNIL